MTLTQNYKFAKLGPKTEMCFYCYDGTYSKSNMQIMNIVLGIDYIDPKSWIRANLVAKLKCPLQFS